MESSVKIIECGTMEIKFIISHQGYNNHLWHSVVVTRMSRRSYRYRHHADNKTKYMQTNTRLTKQGHCIFVQQKVISYSHRIQKHNSYKWQHYHSFVNDVKNIHQTLLWPLCFHSQNSLFRFKYCPGIGIRRSLSSDDI